MPPRTIGGTVALQEALHLESDGTASGREMAPVNPTNVPVLVLNQNFEPLNICRVRRAVVLVLDGKAEVIENGRGELHAITTSVPIPSVVRLTKFVKRP